MSVVPEFIIKWGPHPEGEFRKPFLNDLEGLILVVRRDALEEAVKAAEELRAGECKKRTPCCECSCAWLIAEKLEAMAGEKEKEECICADYDGKGVSTCGARCPLHGRKEEARDA